MNLAEKWAPVLKKCYEISKEHWVNFAAILQNQYNAEINLSKESLRDHQMSLIGETSYGMVNFARFVLPIIRKVWPLLIKAGIRIRPVDSAKDTVKTKVGPIITGSCDKYLDDNGIGSSSEEDIIDHLAKKIAESIIAMVGATGEFQPYLIVAPLDSEFNGFNEAASRALVARHIAIQIVGLPDSIHTNSRVVE